MGSEYDPLFTSAGGAATDGDLETVQESFRRAAAPYLASPVPWLVWGAALPAAALATRHTLAAAGPRGVLLLWSLTILAAGAVEAVIYARRRRHERSSLAGWALRSQGNLSLVAAALSIALLLAGEARLLPALWLLLLGHSLYGLGGLSFPPLRSCGLIYQLGGLTALVALSRADVIFALATLSGNLWTAAQIFRQRR